MGPNDQSDQSPTPPSTQAISHLSSGVAQSVRHNLDQQEVFYLSEGVKARYMDSDFDGAPAKMVGIDILRPNISFYQICELLAAREGLQNVTLGGRVIRPEQEHLVVNGNSLEFLDNLEVKIVNGRVVSARDLQNPHLGFMTNFNLPVNTGMRLDVIA
jgi:hypothetical protein